MTLPLAVEFDLFDLTHFSDKLLGGKTFSLYQNFSGRIRNKGGYSLTVIPVIFSGQRPHLESIRVEVNSLHFCTNCQGLAVLALLGGRRSLRFRKRLWTVNGPRCIVGATPMQIDYPRQAWSPWNGWPLPKWSQAAYKWPIYKQSAGGRSTADRYLMETSSVYQRLRRERQMDALAAIKRWRKHRKSERETHAWHAHMHSQSREEQQMN